MSSLNSPRVGEKVEIWSVYRIIALIEQYRSLCCTKHAFERDGPKHVAIFVIISMNKIKNDDFIYV